MPPHAGTILGHLRRWTSPTVSDAVLLARWTNHHDEAAFAALVSRHGPMVLGVCRRVLGDMHTAEDAFQATFLVLARKAANLRRPESLASFLYGVALRLARKSRGATRRRLVQPLPSLPESADPHPDPLDVVSGRELLALLDAEVARLPEVYRLPVLMCVLQGRTVEEAAQLLGWSSGSVRGRLMRGRDRLRERLTRRGLCPSVATLVLLAPAIVPDRLRAESVHNLAVPPPPAIRALAGGAASTLKLKAVCLGVFVLAATSLGVGLAFLRAPEPEAPSAAAPVTPAAQAKEEPRRDRYGDALPSGAVARLGTLRFRAAGEIESLAFAPDGKALAVSSRGGLFLFDAVSGKRITHLSSSNPAWVSETLLAFSPDGKHLIGKGQAPDGQQFKHVVRIWDLTGARQTREYDLGQSVVWLGWSTKNQPLAIHVEQGALHLRELTTGRSRRFVCDDPQKYPSGLLRVDPTIACATAGQVLALLDNKDAIHVWDTATGRELCTIRPKGDRVYSLTLAPDGSRLALSTPRTVQLWDVATGKSLYAVDFKSISGIVRFTPDGKTLAITDSWQIIRFWDAATGRERGRTQGKYGFAPNFAFSLDGEQLVTSQRHSSAIDLWNVAAGKRKPQPDGHVCRPFGMAFAPTGGRVATCGSSDGSIHFWNLETGEPLTSINRGGMVRNCAYSGDGRSLLASWANDELRVFDADTAEQKHVMKLEDPDRPDTYQSAISMDLSDDGKTLIAFSYYYPKKNGAGPRHNETLITGWNPATHKQLFRRRRPSMSSWLAVSADVRVLASAYPEGRSFRPAPGSGPMRLEDVKTGELLLTFPTLPGQTWPLAFSPDGRLLASNNSDPKRIGKEGQSRNNLRLWETMTAAEVLSLPAADSDRAAFSLDGQLLALAAPSQEIVVWDLARGRERQRFKGFDAEVIDLAFSPDGRRLISGLADSTLLVWDVKAHEPQRAGKLGAEAAAKAWSDLAGRDAVRAFRARGMLATTPDEAIRLLKKHLHPAQPADPQRLRKLLTDLESDQFAVREKAQAALEELGDLAEPALRQTMTNKPTLEVHQRIQTILERLHGPVTRPTTLRSLRAVAVLEDIGSSEARLLLEEVAKGAAEARLTREAKESLRRLAKK